uniref:(northern house mosquito) hypothetical protein n=1 Tax=Culex pipiens TaxID=7175 RepID=A0A8D8KBX1_CULPI
MPYVVLFRDFSQLGMFFLLPLLLPGGTHSSLALTCTRGITPLNIAATWDHPGLFAHRVFAGFQIFGGLVVTVSARPRAPPSRSYVVVEVDTASSIRYAQRALGKLWCCLRRGMAMG